RIVIGMTPDIVPGSTERIASSAIFASGIIESILSPVPPNPLITRVLMLQCQKNGRYTNNNVAKS
ncbi:MAG: hypothetical protein ACJ72Q_21570, partial [Nitrososphaeraceae archaeon]